MAHVALDALDLESALLLLKPLVEEGDAKVAAGEPMSHFDRLAYWRACRGMLSARSRQGPNTGEAMSCERFFGRSLHPP